MNDEHLNDNYERVGRALNNELRPVLAGFVGKTLSTYYRADWWQRGVLEVLTADQRRNLPREGNYMIFTDVMDVQLCRTLIIKNWRDIFRDKMSDAQNSWLGELSAVRNDWAHHDIKKFTDAYVVRAFDTMILFCEPLDVEIADKLRAELNKFQALNPPAESNDDDADITFFRTEGEYSSWCHVIEPKPDICDGTYRKSEFAADLAAVAAGTSKLAEYRDATEFFSRTYLTAGMRRLMIEAMERLVEGNGDPIIEVKTSFGGGKTHSMIALYHLFNRQYNPLTIDEGVQQLFFEARIKDLPKDIHIAVAVGTSLNAAKPKDIPELEGVQSHTFMGEVFSQLARAADRFDLYREYIQYNDERGSSPGVSDLRAFLDGCGACLILIDELVNYGKKLYPGKNFEGGNFDQFIVFLQELSEAVRTSERSMLVVSLPQSEIEIGIDDGGKEVLRTIEHHFGRLQSVWSPVEAHESFEIVRRRLFQPCRREKERDEICAAYAAMYKRDKRGANQKFPLSTKETRYLNRMKACYPIHPQLFDLLYGKWATIEKFQRTRGVLRLMAEIIHKLWSMHDTHSMIMPGAIPLFDKGVRDELIKFLPSNWTAIIEHEIDGENSEPYLLEQDAQKTSTQPARRLTRAIFMGSAPTARGQNVRGLDRQEIMLGVVMPNETSKDVAMFNTMLDTKLQTRLTYLYSDETHYWFDGRPTLRKVAEQFEQSILDDDVEYEIECRLDKMLDVRGVFNAKYITTIPSRVPDEPCVRLVVMPPSMPFDRRSREFYSTLEKILNYSRENTARICKNMLLFLAGNKAGLESLKKLVRRQMAWARLSKERDLRNLDQKQIAEVEKNLKELEKNSQQQLSMAYNFLLEPTVVADDMKEIEWRETELNFDGRPNIEVIGETLIRRDSMIKKYEPFTLASELRKHLLKGAASWVTLKRLWEYTTQYMYAPRLYDQKVLRETVKVGVRDGFFGLADDVDELTGEFIGLRMNEPIEIASLDQLIVRFEEAEAQLKKDEPPIEEIVEPTVEEPPVESEPVVEDETEEPPPTTFRAEFELNLARPSRGIDRIAEEIVDILTSLDGSKVTMRLAVEGYAPDGIPEPEAEALKQNCQQLKAKNFRLEP